MGQGLRDTAPALDAREAESLNGRVAHGMHLVLSMCTGNAVVTKDPIRARKLDKGRTDEPQAMAQAFSIALRTKETSGAYAEDSFKFVWDSPLPAGP